MCGVVQRRGHAGRLGLRGRAERRRRHLRLVRRQRRPAALPRGGRAPRASTSTTTSPSSPASRRSARTGCIALDWNNGNRSVLVDHELSGLIVGLTLGTRAEDVYRALIEATAFGTRKIIETFEASGLPVRRADRRRRAAQEPGDHADLRRRHAAAAAPHRLRAGPRAGLGDARGGRRRRVPRHLRRGGRDGQASRRDVYAPDEARADAYDALYEHYSTLHDHFGRGGDDVMHALRHIRPREVARG